ncbi:MAG: hypothetical protein FWH07_00695 [Oscillospiraceae bacterium]|nr:hypothetical protein [Oscillospiraceae bacterium]
MEKVKETFSKTYTTTKEKWTGLAGKTRAVILAVAGVIIVSAIVITALLNTSSHVLLCKTSGADEALEITNVLATAGIADVRTNLNNDVLVPENVVVLARTTIVDAGLPRPGFNYDTWDTGVSMFSTDRDKNEKAKHQLQEWIMAQMTSIPQVESAMVILHIPNSQNYVMVEDRQEPRATVMLTLKAGQTLSNEQIKGIHLMVLNAIPDIKEHNITVTDGNGIQLIPDDLSGRASDDLALMQQRLTLEAGMISLMADNAEARLNPLLAAVWGEGGYYVAVNVELDFSDDGEVIEEIFTPVEGLDGGIIRTISEKAAAGGTALDGGLIGFPNNGDVAPDYPTVPEVEPGGEFYVEWGRDVYHEINRRLETYKNTGLRIKRTTASLVVDSEPLAPAEIETWQGIVQNATGAMEVTVATRVFALSQTPGDRIGFESGDMTRNILIWIIVALGVLLVILFILAITTSGSKKKRFVRNRTMAYATEGAGGYISDDSFQPVIPDQDAFELQSLLEETDTKDVVLKREIKEFSKTNPDIIAQLIRTWLRDDEV